MHQLDIEFHRVICLKKYILLYILNLSFQIQIIFGSEYLMDQLHTHFLTPGGIMLDTSIDVRNPKVTRMCLLIPKYLYPLKLPALYHLNLEHFLPKLMQ